MSSQRYCFTCEEITTFNLNRCINHSECSVCGSRFGLHPNNRILKHFTSRIQKIHAKYKSEPVLVQLENLKRKVKNLKATIRSLRGKRCPGK